MVFPGTTLHMECLFMKVNCESGDQLLTQLLDVRHTIMDLPQHHRQVTPPGEIKDSFSLCIDTCVALR